jgi:hypothetical protein
VLVQRPGIFELIRQRAIEVLKFAFDLPKTDFGTSASGNNRPKKAVRYEIDAVAVFSR